MADAQEQCRPIEGRTDLIEDLMAGMKPLEQALIGTEHEKFPYKETNVEPVAFEGHAGIEALLKGLLELDDCYSPTFEGEHVIGLKRPSSCGKFASSITLEPGGQFELSGAPLQNLHQTADELQAHLDDVRRVAGPLGVQFLGNGYSPKFSLSETPHMPKGRYDVMRAYMPRVGGLGLDMMHCTSTVQVNLDFSSEADMVRKFRVGLALQPLATALFANSAFSGGQLNGYQSYRSEIWLDVDPARTGMLPFVFEEGMGFERYVDYALNVPMYFLYRGGRYLDTGGKSFQDFLDGKIEGVDQERANLDDWELHLTTLFPEVRLKRFLEMRGADCGPQPYLTALSAFWTGLFYEPSCLDAAYDLIRPFNNEVLDQLRREVPKKGLRSKVGAYELIAIAKEVLAMADAGLKARGCLNEQGQSEQIYLEPVHEIAEDGWSQSDRLIDLFKTVWGGDINQLYKTQSF